MTVARLLDWQERDRDFSCEPQQGDSRPWLVVFVEQCVDGRFSDADAAGALDARSNCTTTAAGVAARDGTTLANTDVSTVAADAASFIHRYADDAQTPNRSATTRGMSPVAFTSAINRSRSSAVCRLRMPHVMPDDDEPSTDGFHAALTVVR